MLKRTISLIISLCLVFTLSACVNKEPISENADDSEIGNMLSSEKDIEEEKSDDGEIHMLGSYPEYMRGWNDKESDDKVFYSYSGGEIVVPHHIANGGFKTTYGMSVLLDGIFQDFYIVDDKTGEKSSQEMILRLTLDKNEEKNFTIHFVPNTGKSGEALEISVGLFYDLDYKINEGAEFLSYGNEHDFKDVKCRRVSMKTDAPNQEKIVLYDAPLTKIDPSLFEFWVYDAPEEMVGEFIYSTGEYEGKGTTSYIYGKADAKNKYMFDLIAPKGTYRVSVFVDHIQQSIMDSVKYIEVYAEENKTAHIELEIDNTGMSGWHHIYFMARQIDGDYDYGKITSKSNTYILMLE